MDEDIAEFLREFGPPVSHRNVPITSLDRYRGKLPDQLLAYWEQYGWSAYADGLLWIVDPAEYEAVVEAWIGQTRFGDEDSYHAIARGAFGDLYLFGERHGSMIAIAPMDSMMTPPDSASTDLDLAVRAFFGTLLRGVFERLDEQGEALFARAREKLGTLEEDEMYCFVPALALGGKATLRNLEKAKAVEHLIFLSQLSDLQILDV